MNKVHLLIIHPGFCIRAKKQVEALISQTSYKITIITDVNRKGVQLTNYIKNNSTIISYNFHRNIFFRLKFRKMLAKIINSVDIIHCHNEPNYHIVDTIKVCSGKIPIIYDIHDFTSMRSGKKCKNEKTAYEMSDVIVHVSTNFIHYALSFISSATSNTALTILSYPVHLHKLPASQYLTSVSEGEGLWSNNALAAIKKPGVQIPH